MKSADVRRKYIEFFKKRGHVEIPSAPLVPENDPTTLFTSSGMQPLIPYLLGQSHPSGNRLVDVQRSFRAGDIEEVGDNRHTTFFEMLGNWSLGDYFKKEQLSWIFEFLTKELQLDPKRLYVTVFKGNEFVPKDTESIDLWKEIFMQVGVDAKEGEKIFAYPANKNWWSRSGEPKKMPAGEPGGPDSEVFFDFGKPIHEGCHPNCECGRFMEIANSVFMQYQKQEDGTLKELSQKNVDFGGGLERMVAATNDDPDVFNTDLFVRAKKVLEEVNLAGDTKNIRIILDHVRAAMFIIDSGIEPSNKERGYILRRLIRRAAVHSKIANIDLDVHLVLVLKEFGEVYSGVYPSILKNRGQIHEVISNELQKFDKTLEKGMKMIGKASSFDLFQTYGFPPEIIEELMKRDGLVFDKEEFEQEFKKHQELSRTASRGMFKGGLADHSEETKKLHTAMHLLHEALHLVLGDHVQQKGSNITQERLRFDFSHPAKLTSEEIKKVEDLVNEKIGENLPVSFEILEKDEALKSGARAFFGERYGDKVKVYTIGNFSKEICGGPHVEQTGILGQFKIIKEESAGAGIRRMYATLS